MNNLIVSTIDDDYEPIVYKDIGTTPETIDLLNILLISHATNYNDRIIIWKKDGVVFGKWEVYKGVISIMELSDEEDE